MALHPFVVGERLTVDKINGLLALIRSFRPLPGRHVQIDTTPNGSVINSEAGSAAVPALAPPASKRPWDIELRQPAENVFAAVKFLRTYAMKGGVYSRIILDTSSDEDGWTTLPAVSADSSWIVAARIIVTVGDDGSTLDTASIIYYSDDSDGWSALTSASKTILDSVIQPLFIVKFTAGGTGESGTWAIAEDLRTIPQLAIYA